MIRIAIEEHFITREYYDYLLSRKVPPRLEFVKDSENNRVLRHFRSSDPRNSSVWPPNQVNGLLDIGTERLKAMDNAGINMQVLSLNTPGVEAFDTPDGIVWAKKTNDELFSVIEKYPDRFAGFAALPCQDPTAAADELERAVKQLGFKGAKINSHVRGEYLDDQKYWVIFEMAEKLDVPIYLHPREPSPDMIKPLLAYPALTGSMYGLDIEASLHAMRLILGGVFDRFPNLIIILGHLGEALPLWLWRMDSRWRRQASASDPVASKIKKTPGQYVKGNYLVTTSGMFWQPGLMCAYLALGADKILFAVDHPQESVREAVEFMDAAPICDIDKEKIYHLNVEKVLAL